MNRHDAPAILRGRCFLVTNVIGSGLIVCYAVSRNDQAKLAWLARFAQLWAERAYNDQVELEGGHHVGDE